MEIQIHTINNITIAELHSTEVIINNIEDGSDLVGNIYYQGFDKMIIHQDNITAEFFDLKNGIAGEILQKFSNYRIRLAIVGNFSRYASKSLNDFIFESNKRKHICFVASQSEAIAALTDS